jgi:hypothetical protein
MLTFKNFLDEIRKVDPAKLADRVFSRFGSIGVDPEEGEHVFEVPISNYKDENSEIFDDADSKVHNKISKNSSSKDGIENVRYVTGELDKRKERKTLKISDLVPIQPSVSVRNKNELEDKLNDTGRVISVAKINGKHYIKDGHHAVAAAMLNGNKDIDADVVDYDKILKEDLTVHDMAGKVIKIKKVPIRMADGTIQLQYPGKSGSSGGGGD